MLDKPGFRHKIVFKAPTGAGKTVAMACLMQDLATELPQRHDLGGQRQIAWIWLAPNQLHLQSYGSLRRFFAERGGDVRPVQFEAVEDRRLRANDCLFLNWQSVSSEGNVFVRGNEQGQMLDEIFTNTRVDGVELVAILDEAHLFGTKGEKALQLLARLDARMEIDVTATPLSQSEFTVVIRRHEVAKEQMIKKGVHLNPQIDASAQAPGQDADLLLLDRALEKRAELARKYREAGTNVNPLLLIQLPSDIQRLTDLDAQLKAKITAHLDLRGFTAANRLLAVWLSNEKTNLGGIEQPNCVTDVLLFKQAIAMGWDCPRAAVLLIYREMRQEAFTVQTLGRILRMPEQKHYPDDALNHGYVFTNLQANFIKIEHDEADYINLQRAVRKPEYAALALPSFFAERTVERNRLGLEFKKALFDVAQERFGIGLETGSPQGFFFENAEKLKAKGFRLDVRDIEIELPADLYFQDEIADDQTLNVRRKARFAKTPAQVKTLYERFCLENCGDFQRDGSWERLRLHLQLLLQECLGLDETQAFKTVLANEQSFRDLLALARDRYVEMQAEKAKGKTASFKTQEWEVPEFRIYYENYARFEVERHILEPLFLRKRPGGKLADSDAEFTFIQFLEENKAHVAWWYKNGAGGRGDFAVPYLKLNGERALFFPDFILLLNNGTLCFLDTKTPGSDPEAAAKHDAILEYAERRRASGKPALGSVILPWQGSWRYLDRKMKPGETMENWQVFNPAWLGGEK